MGRNPRRSFKNANVVPFLRACFSAVLDSGYFRQLWSKSIIVPIFNNILGNYRGISLVSVVSNVFTCILNRRITVWIDEGEKIAEQAGFMSEYSTTNHLFYHLFKKAWGKERRKSM